MTRWDSLRRLAARGDSWGLFGAPWDSWGARVDSLKLLKAPRGLVETRGDSLRLAKGLVETPVDSSRLLGAPVDSLGLVETRGDSW